MKITSTPKKIFSAHSDRLPTRSPQSVRAGKRSLPQNSQSPKSPHNNPTASSIRGILAILLLLATTLPAQIPRDSLEAMTDRANAHYFAEENPEAMALFQTIAASYRSMGDIPSACQAMSLQALSASDAPDQAIAILDSAITLYQSACTDTSHTYFRLWKNKARMLLDLGEFDAAHHIQTQTNGLIPQCLAEGTPEAFNDVLHYHYETAAFKKDLGLLMDAIDGLQATIAFGQTQPAWANQRYMAGTYSDLSQTYRKLGDFFLAEEFNRMAHQLITQNPVPTAIEVTSQLQYQSDYAAILIDAKKFQEAETILQPLLRLYEAQTPVNQGKIGACHALMGSLFARTNSLDRAWKHTQIARSAFVQLGEGASVLVARMDINLAGIARKQQRFGRAARAAIQATETLRAHHIANGSDLSKAWREAALAAMASAQYSQARTCIHQAMQATLPSTEPDPIRVHPSHVFSQMEYLQALHTLAQIHEMQYAITRDSIELLQAAEAYTHAVDFMVYLDAGRLHLRESYFTWERLWKDNAATVEAAIRCNIALHRRTGQPQYAAKALAIADLSKASLITKSHLLYGKQLSSLVPTWVHEIEKALVETIEWRRQQVQKAQDPAAVQAAIRDLSLAESKLDQGKKWLQEQYPRYYALQYEGATRTSTQPLHHPAPAQAFLEYFVGQDSIYAFLQTTHTLQVAIIPHLRYLEALTNAFRDCILTSATEREITPLGTRLLHHLFPFTMPREEIRSLLIIPDGFLHHLPFCALVVPQNDVPENDQGIPQYLIQYVALQQDFSIHAHAQATQARRSLPPLEAIHGLFPRAPYTYCDSLSGRLVTEEPPYQSQVMDIFTETGMVQDSQAYPPTRKTFFAALRSPSLILLKTHGFYEDGARLPHAATPENFALSSSYILLQNPQGQAEPLYMQELYSLTAIRTRLLILNACDIAQGPYQPGEGPLSIARALRQAGCTTLLTNRWQADDQYNEQLISRYCAALLTGAPTDQALRQAQCAALSGTATARPPKYWAGLVSFGTREGM